MTKWQCRDVFRKSDLSELIKTTYDMLPLFAQCILHFLILATGKLDADTDEVEYTRNKYDDDDNEEDEGESDAARELALDDPNHPGAVEPHPVCINLLVDVKISI